MEIKKKLDLMRIGKHLQDVYQRELIGFSVAEQPELKRVGLLGEKMRHIPLLLWFLL